MSKRKREPSNDSGCTLEDLWFLLIEDGRVETIELIVSRYPSILNIQDADGRTALMQTMNQNTKNGVNLELFDELIDLGANVRVLDNKGEDALCWFMDVWFEDKVYLPRIQKMVDLGADLSLVNHYAQSTFANACEAGRGAYIINAGFDLRCEFQDYRGLTCLMHAIINDLENGYVYDKGIVRLFIEAGVDLNIQDKDGNTALMFAFKYSRPFLDEKHAEIMKQLISNGAEVNIQDKDGNTLLPLIINLESSRSQINGSIDIDEESLIEGKRLCIDAIEKGEGLLKENKVTKMLELSSRLQEVEFELLLSSLEGPCDKLELMLKRLPEDILREVSGYVALADISKINSEVEFFLAQKVLHISVLGGDQGIVGDMEL